MVPLIKRAVPRLSLHRHTVTVAKPQSCGHLCHSPPHCASIRTQRAFLPSLYSEVVLSVECCIFILVVCAMSHTTLSLSLSLSLCLSPPLVLFFSHFFSPVLYSTDLMCQLLAPDPFLAPEEQQDHPACWKILFRDS